MNRLNPAAIQRRDPLRCRMKSAAFFPPALVELLIQVHRIIFHWARDPRNPRVINSGNINNQRRGDNLS